ncbi:MAG: hypothetical protein JJ975_13970 [Bacteroidia bacterium]|nr:hypothetical protein [Bacteroidia bacterium]
MTELSNSVGRRAAVGALIVFLVLRYLILIRFNWQFVDSDQAVNWLTAVDLSEARFYSPYFYGQFYNSILEAFCSAPWIALGLPVEKVVPLVSNLLGALPFLTLFFFFYSRSNFVLAMVTLAVATCLPIEYHLISSMTRGFMGGLVVLITGFAFVHYSRWMFQFIGYLLCLVSIFINPNASVVLAPFALFWIIQHKQYQSHRKPLLVGAAGFVLIYMAFQLFKAKHPTYQIHKLWELELSWNHFTDSVLHINERLASVVPFLPNHGGILFLMLGVILTLVAVRQRSKTSIILIVGGMGFVLLSFFVNKTTDGSTSIFFPYSRMYLGVPILLVLALSQLITSRLTFKSIGVLSTLVILGFGLQASRLNEVVEQEVRLNSGHVQVKRIYDLCVACNELKALADENQCELMVFHSKTDEYTYGCKALHPELRTIHPEYDRRAWTFEQEGRKVYDRVLFLDWNLSLDKLMLHQKGEISVIKNVSYPAYLLENNNVDLITLYRINGLRLRKPMLD